MPKAKHSDQDKLRNLRSFLLEHGAKNDDTVFVDNNRYSITIGDDYLDIDDIENGQNIILHSNKIGVHTPENIKDFKLDKFVEDVKTRILGKDKSGV